MSSIYTQHPTVGQRVQGLLFQQLFFSLLSLFCDCQFVHSKPTCLLDTVSVLPTPRPKIHLDFGILLHRCAVLLFLDFQS